MVVVVTVVMGVNKVGMEVLKEGEVGTAASREVTEADVEVVVVAHKDTEVVVMTMATTTDTMVEDNVEGTEEVPLLHLLLVVVMATVVKIVITVVVRQAEGMAAQQGTVDMVQEVV